MFLLSVVYQNRNAHITQIMGDHFGELLSQVHVHQPARLKHRPAQSLPFSSANPLPIISEAMRRQTHRHARNESYRMPHCRMDSRLNLHPNPPLGFIPQVVEFMTDDEPLHTLREVFSHIDLTFSEQGKPESRVQILSGLIDHF